MDYISQGEENEAVLKWSGGGGEMEAERELCFPICHQVMKSGNIPSGFVSQSVVGIYLSNYLISYLTPGSSFHLSPNRNCPLTIS